MVRKIVEQTLNEQLQNEAENLLKAKPYERSESCGGLKSGAILVISKQSLIRLN